MRIRKLAKDLDCSPEQILGLLQQLGQTRYRDPEQQLPDPMVLQVRKRAADLKKSPAWRPPAAEPIRRFDDRPAAARPAPSAEDAAAMAKHLGDVRPLAAPQPSGKPPAPKAVAARPTTSPGLAAPKGPSPLPPVRPVVSTLPRADLRSDAPADVLARAAEEEVRALRAVLVEERGELLAERTFLREERERVRAERDDLLRRAEAAEAEAARQRGRADALQARVDETLERMRAAESTVKEAPAPRVEVPLRRLLEGRGLRGDDEFGALLAGFAEAHRTRELLDVLQLTDPAPVELLLSERVVLVGPGEDAPAGLVPVRVAADRGEGPGAAGVRVAINRLVTALLVRGLRRLVVFGGPGSAVRVLREALDPRVELRLFPTPRGETLPDVPAGAVVVLWGDAAEDRRLYERHPQAVRVAVRDLARMCTQVVEQLDRT